MKKKILAAFLAVTSVFMSFSSVMADDAITVIVNNKEVVFEEVSPFIENGHTLVPFRAIFEALGSDVVWDGERRTVLSYDEASGTTIGLQIDSNSMLVNNSPVTLETPARIVNDFTVVPVRAISEGLNRQVDWDNDTRTVTVH